LRREIEVLLVPLKKAGADAKWIPPGNLHFTLKFLGSASPDQISRIKNSLKKLCARQRPFLVHCAGLGGFPDLDHPKVLWVGADEGESELRALAAAVEAEMAGSGFAKEERDFSPHLTIGRVRGGKNLDRLVHEMKKAAFSSAEKAVMGHLTLYKSFLTREGSAYEPLQAFPFGGVRGK
jgi:2'-5' RNA ligase